MQTYRVMFALSFKRFDMAETAVPVCRSILTELFPLRFSDMACLRRELNVRLYALSRVLHPPAGPGNIFRAEECVRL